MWILLCILYHTIPYYNIPYSIIPYYTIPYYNMPYSIIPYYTMPYYNIPHYTIPYYTIPYYTIPYTIVYHTILQGSLCLCGLWGPRVWQEALSTAAPRTELRGAEAMTSNFGPREQPVYIYIYLSFGYIGNSFEYFGGLGRRSVDLGSKTARYS